MWAIILIVIVVLLAIWWFMTQNQKPAEPAKTGLPVGPDRVRLGRNCPLQPSRSSTKQRASWGWGAGSGVGYARR